MARYVLVIAILLTSAVAQAQVKIERRTTMTSSVLDQTIVTTDWTAVKGDRMIESNPASATLVDLKTEKVYTLNHFGRTYTVETFDSIRESNASDPQDDPDIVPAAEELAALQQKMRAFLDGSRIHRAPSGQSKTVNGWHAQEVVTTMRMPLSGGAMTSTTTEWVAEVPGVGEIDAFKKRYETAVGPQLSPDELAALASGSAFAGMPTNPNITIDDTVSGTTVLSISKSGPADGTPELTGPGSLGVSMLKDMAGQAAFGFLGLNRLGRVAAGVINAIQELRSTGNGAGATGGPIGVPSSTIQIEVIRVSSDVSDEDLSIPAGYKEVR